MGTEDTAGISLARVLVNQAWSHPMTDEPLQEARDVLENALKLYPDHVATLTCLGAVLCDLRLHSDARAVLERAVRLGSTDRNTFFNLFVAMLGQTTRDEAHAVLDRGVHLERDESTWEAYFDPHAQ